MLTQSCGVLIQCPGGVTVGRNKSSAPRSSTVREAFVMGRLSIPVLLLCMIVGVAAKRQTYIVQTEPSSGGDVNAQAVSYQNMVSEALQFTSAGLQGTLDTLGSNESPIFHVYENVMSGFAARLTPEQVKYLETMSGVVGVYPERTLKVQTTHTPEQLGLSQKKGSLWPVSKYGSDVIIGMLDTGVWPESASFSDRGMGPIPARWKGACVPGTKFTTKNCNKKLIGARYYFKGYEAENGPLNETVEIRSARDNEGHGTHTSSTAGGRFVAGASLFGFAPGTARGMAPNSRIAVYKVCWANGCTSSDILAAYDQAVADGVDVISFSIGDTEVINYFQDTIAIGSFGAIKKGVFVSASAGNSGPGPFTVRNVAPWLMTVAAGTVDRQFSLDVLLGNGKKFYGQSFYSGRPLSNGSVPLILGADAALTNQADASLCFSGSLDPAKVKGKVVFCWRGINGRVEKGLVVLQAGGVGMILGNTVAGGDSLIADNHVLPATMVTYNDGNAIQTYAKKATKPLAKLLLPATTTLGVRIRAPAIADFSSRGPTPQSPLLLKPDVVGPGVSVLAAWPTDVSLGGDPSDLRRSKFNIISGTSMSCPHISGLGALLRSAHPKWSPAAIRSALMTTATTLDNSKRTMLDAVSNLAATPYAFGSGFVQPEKATNPGLIYDLTPQDHINFLCASGYTAQQMKVFDSRPNPCPAKPIRIEDFNYPSFTALFAPKTASGHLVKTFRRTLTNVGVPSCAYKASVTNVPVGCSVTVHPSILTFKTMNQKLTFTLTVTVPASPFPPSGNFTTEFAYLQWADKVHVVRSPIAITKQG